MDSSKTETPFPTVPGQRSGQGSESVMRYLLEDLRLKEAARRADPLPPVPALQQPLRLSWA